MDESSKDRIVAAAQRVVEGFRGADVWTTGERHKAINDLEAAVRAAEPKRLRVTGKLLKMAQRNCSCGGGDWVQNLGSEVVIEGVESWREEP